jgi:hypothetical protein
LDRASYGIDNPVDWTAVAQDYDAVHVTQKVINQVPDLDLWDFESTVWFNPSKLEVDQISPVDRKTGKIDLSQDVAEEATTRKRKAMKGEVTLKKNSETKFTVYLDDEKIGELNQVEESVGREDSVVYLWLWDPSDDRFRDRALEDGGYYNPNKLLSELEELIARTPEKKGKKAMLRRRRRAAGSRSVSEDRKDEMVMAAIGEWIAGGAEAAGAKVKNTGHGGLERKWFEANRPFIRKLCEQGDQMVWDMVRELDLP